MKACSQKGCTNPPTYTYDWPGADGEQCCCLRHSVVVKQMGEALGLTITLHLLGPLGEMTEAEQRFADKALARLASDERELVLKARTERRHYEAPAISSERSLDSTWQVGHALLECIREMGPGDPMTIKIGSLGALSVWFKRETDPESVLQGLQMLRKQGGQPAIAGLLNNPRIPPQSTEPEWMQDPKVCSCDPAPRLGIGETTCPNCGGSRA